MAKNFSPRLAKNERSVVKIESARALDVLQLSDKKLLEGAKLSEVRLDRIVVRTQVRTRFNDDSLRELAENIRANGLIQPLVIHREGTQFVLLCGERRYRAMRLIDQESAPCYILEGKSAQELMAIQFSENSSREELHYIDKADGIYNYHLATGASERKIQNELGISKSEVHRSLLLAKLPIAIKEAAKRYNIEKYVLLEYDGLEEGSCVRDEIEKEILTGKLTKRSQLSRRILALHSGTEIVQAKRSQLPAQLSPRIQQEVLPKEKVVVPRGLSASAFVKIMTGQTKKMKLDPKTKELVEHLLKETTDIIKQQ